MGFMQSTTTQEASVSRTMIRTLASMGLPNELASAIELGGNVEFCLSRDRHDVTCELQLPEGGRDYTEMRLLKPDRTWVGSSVTIRRPTLRRSTLNLYGVGSMRVEPASISHSSSSSSAPVADAEATVALLQLAIETAKLLDRFAEDSAGRIAQEKAQYIRQEAEREERLLARREAAAKFRARLNEALKGKEGHDLRVTMVDGQKYTGQLTPSDNEAAIEVGRYRLMVHGIEQVEVKTTQSKYAPFRAISEELWG